MSHQSRRYKRDLTAQMRELGFYPEGGMAGSGHLWFTHENKHVKHVSAASSPSDADEQIRIVIGKAKRAMRAANIDVDAYQDRAKLKAFHELPNLNEQETISWLLQEEQTWHTIHELAHQLWADPNDTATIITRLENRGVVVRMIDDDGPARYAAASRIAPTKEEPMTVQDVTDWRGIAVPPAVLEQNAGTATKLADGWRTLMQVLESHGGWLPSAEAKRLAAAGSSASEAQIRKIAAPGGIVIWREQKQRGGSFWALPGVEVPGARPPSGRAAAAPAPQTAPVGVSPPPAPRASRKDSTEDVTVDARADLVDLLLIAIDSYIDRSGLKDQSDQITQLTKERDQLAAKIEQIEDVLTAASSGIHIT